MIDTDREQCSTPRPADTMGSPHALVLPYPANGHVVSLIELSLRLVDCGFRVTFVNTEHNHHRLLSAVRDAESAAELERLRLVAVPDGMAPGEDRNDLGRLTAAILRVMPGRLEELIRETNESSAGGGDGITCMVADQSMGWALDVARKMRLRAAVFWPASAGMLATIFSIPKLIEDGVIDSDGRPTGNQMFQLAAGMPPMSSNYLVWNHCGDSASQPVIYQHFVGNNRASEFAEFIICNSFVEAERPVFAHFPRILPVGPLLAAQRRRGGKPVGHLWPEEPGCAAWLDGQPAGSVVYAAFGSSAILDPRQFMELAKGLELSGRPFLWVARPDLTAEPGAALPGGLTAFQERVGWRGRVVGWAPQQEVLAHRSLACFVSHCGWNSTMEGVASGVPFLCWPYYGDQFPNRDYVCGAWKTGLSLTPDADGLVTGEEIREKLEALLGDEGIRERALQLRVAARRSAVGGASFENLHRFAEGMKG